MTSVCLLNYYHFNRIAHSKVFPSSRQEAICAARVCRDIHPVKRVYSRVFVRRSWTATAVRKSNHQIKRSREVPFVSARHGMVLCGEGDRGEIHADGFMMCGDYRSRWWWLFIVDHNKVCGQVLSIDKTEYFFYWAATIQAPKYIGRVCLSIPFSGILFTTSSSQCHLLYSQLSDLATGCQCREPFCGHNMYIITIF